MNDRLPLPALFAGYDYEPRAYDLPVELVRLRDGYRRLATAAHPQPVSPPEVGQQLITATAQAACAGDPLPDVAALADARRQRELADDAAFIRQQALEMLRSRITATVADLGDEIITGHLRPAYTAIITELADAFALTAEHADSPTAILAAPKRVRDAWLAIDRLMTPYAAIHAARFALSVAGVKASDDAKDYSEIKNIDVVWPSVSRQYNPSPPWGREASSRDRLRYLLTHGAELWLPTPAEQDARYLEVHGEAIRRMAASRQNAQAYAAIFS